MPSVISRDSLIDRPGCHIFTEGMSSRSYYESLQKSCLGEQITMTARAYPYIEVFGTCGGSVPGAANAPLIVSDRARSSGSAFMRNLPKQPEKWYDMECYCNALDPLLRLAARDTERFYDLTGEEGKPQVH